MSLYTVFVLGVSIKQLRPAYWIEPLPLMYAFRVNNSDPLDSRLIAWLTAGLDKERGKTQAGLANYLGWWQGIAGPSR